MSLRSYLDALEFDHDLHKVGKTVNQDYELASYIRNSCDHQGPALIFDVDGNPVRVIGGVYGTQDRVKRILTDGYGLSGGTRLSNNEAVQVFDKCSNVTRDESIWDNFSLTAEAECHGVVKTGDDVNLFSLPICTHNHLDKSRFVTAGVQAVKWIDGDTHGLGIHRMCLIDRNHLACLAPPNRRVGYPHYVSETGVEMAVIIGAPPEVVLASQAKVGTDVEKYIVAQNIARFNKTGRVQLTKCKSFDLFVPAESELVLECVTVPKSSYDDTPFAEYPGTYSYRSDAFIVEVKAITHRQNYMYQTILTGKVPQEDSNLCAIPYAGEIYRAAKTICHTVTDVSTFFGNSVFSAVVCIKKTSDAEVMNLLYTLLGNRYVKSVAILDHDLPADEEGFRFAFETRYQPDKDTVIMENPGLGASLDPSSPVFQATSKIGFDLTVPHGTDAVAKRQAWKRHEIATTLPDIAVEDRFWV